MTGAEWYEAWAAFYDQHIKRIAAIYREAYRKMLQEIETEHVP